jgi:Zn-dependent protease with chaperone function
MPWLRCPHCSTFLPDTDAAQYQRRGCPVCGSVFVVSSVRSSSPTQQIARPSPAKPTRRPLADLKMASLNAIYPPGPRNVPADLTAPNLRYRQGVLLLLGTLVLFFAVYLGLLLGSGGLFLWSVARWRGLASLLLAFVSLLIFLYLFKGLFKTERQDKSLQVEITAEDQPRLFAFLDRLCEEVGAPPPHRVFLSPEVNAAACYERSLLGLLLPTPKNLILGLGLVNVLTLSEIKAVLAHEFGHFAQGSMKLGAYVYAVNRVLREIVLGRDWLDHLLLRLRAQPYVLGLLGAVCWGTVSGLRRLMTGLFYAINFLDKSLSRQMEFHADLIAVSVSGSEAIVRALARMDFANEALEAAAFDLKVAADHDRYSRDLFVHHRDALERLRRQRNAPHLGEPPPPTGDPRLVVEVFDPEDGPPRMWADHPSNYDREQNAKQHYVDCPLDNRPAWLLFDNAAEACEWVTWRFYRVALKVHRDTELEEPEAIRTFLDAEHRAVTYDPRYHGMYDDRFIEPGEVNERIALDCYETLSPEVLRERYEGLYSDIVAKQAAAFRRHLEEKQRVLAYRREHGRDRDEPLKFRGRRYWPEDIKELSKFLDDQLTQDRRQLAKEDREVFFVHYQMSQYLGAQARQVLRQRYTFHLALQKLLANLLEQQEQLESALAFIVTQPEGVLPAETFAQLYRLFRGVRDTLVQTLEAADKLRLPPLPHLQAGARLGPLLWDRPVVGRLGQSGRSISAQKIQKLYNQLAAVIDRAKHLHFKSLGSILKLQEEIARRWLAQFAGSTAAAKKKIRD